MSQVESHPLAEFGDGAGACPVPLMVPRLHNVFDHIQVLGHVVIGQSVVRLEERAM